MKEYQFKVGNVWLDVHADTEKEAVRVANDNLCLLEQPVIAPGAFQRVQLDISRRLTAKDIVSVYDLKIGSPVTQKAVETGKVTKQKTIKVLRILRKPLTAKQVKRLAKDNILTVVVPLSLDELQVNIDCLNDAVSTMITGEESALEDISYRPVGVKGEDVLVEVAANVENWLNRQAADGAIVRRT